MEVRRFGNIVIYLYRKTIYRKRFIISLIDDIIKMTNKSSSLICVFCDNTGHRIHQCSDPRIDVLDYQTKKYAAIQIFFSTFAADFLEKKLSFYTIPEVRVLGYKHNISNRISMRPSRPRYYEYIKELMEYYINGLSHEDVVTILNTIPISSKIQMATELKEIYSANGISKRKIVWDMISVMETNRRFAIRFSNEECDEIVSSDGSEDSSIDGESECPICHDKSHESTQVFMNCGHSVCAICFFEYLHSMDKSYEVQPCCCLCRTLIRDVTIKNEELVYLFTNRWNADINSEESSQQLSDGVCEDEEGDGECDEYEGEEGTNDEEILNNSVNMGPLYLYNKIAVTRSTYPFHIAMVVITIYMYVQVAASMISSFFHNLDT